MSEDNPAVDQVAGEAPRPESPLQQNLKSRNTWLRFVFMLLFGVLISLAGMVGSVVVVLGFLWVLFTGAANPELRQVGRSIATYMYQIALYLTFNTDERPFPMGGEWPAEKDDVAPEASD